MRWRTIALIVSLAVFAVGILLSIFFNALFLFFFLPFGFAWTFGRKGNTGKSEQFAWTRNAATQQFCTHCGARLAESDLFCPICGKSVRGRVSRDDLR